MADTGWVLCTAAQDLADGNGSVSWSSVTNIVSSNDVYAAWTSGSSKNTDTLKAHTFGLSLPSGATIDGVETRVEAKESGTVVIANVRIGKSDAALGTAKTPGDALTSTDANYDHGGASDLWGLTFTEAEVEAATFQIRYVFGLTGASTVQVDAVWVKVYYTEAAGSAAASSAGDANATAASSALVSASAEASGAAVAESVSSVVASIAASASGAATAEAEGEGEIGPARGFSSGAAVAEAVTAVIASVAGSATGAAEATGQTPIAEVVTYPPVGGGGGIAPPYYSEQQRFRIRKEKSKPRVYVIKTGNWPTEEELARAEREEQREFSRFVNGIQPNRAAPVESDDEEELVAILSMLA